MSDEMLARVFACIDNTTLNATDNNASVEEFCRHTKNLTINSNHSTLSVAAVCVYPRFVGVASKVLAGSGIKVASVAGAFPHGQLPLELKVAEVQYAVAQGADEVDVVLSRGALLAGERDTVVREVQAMKEACQGCTLKVILETGELPSPTLIADAAQLAIDGGADFIKTSTGKIAVGATLEAAETMLRVVQENAKKRARKVGFKAAGGIRHSEDALRYARLAQQTMGDEYLSPTLFRIGASSLTDELLKVLA